MFVQMIVYQNYMHQFRELLMIYAGDKTIQMKEVWGVMPQQHTTTSSRLRNTTCGKRPLYHGMPEMISIHYTHLKM
jgi:hypothetical protein